MAKRSDLAVAQFIGYHHGKHEDLIGMVRAMGLTKREWKKLRLESMLLTDSESKELDAYFKLTPKETIEL